MGRTQRITKSWDRVLRPIRRAGERRAVVTMSSSGGGGGSSSRNHKQNLCCLLVVALLLLLVGRGHFSHNRGVCSARRRRAYASSMRVVEIHAPVMHGHVMLAHATRESCDAYA